jgi:2,4-dienoyl-CoA reductase-like NADH-dependent reductase (Old Yellow Enzyme family)
MSLLFSPARIGHLEVKNRLVHSATYEAMAGANGEITEQLLKRYTNLAKGETGLIIPGYMYVDESGRALRRQTGIYSDDLIPGLKRLTDAVHYHDGKVVFQLVHAGRQTTRSVAGQVPIGPSSSGRDPVNFVRPREMDENDIQEVIRAFGKAAARAVEAGADGVQIHAAHGYLINQFLSPFFNRRGDDWGSTDENRFRFVEHVFREMKKSIPDTTPILIKLNTNDHTPDAGISPELARLYAESLVALGIDAIEISSGTALYSFMDTCRGEVPVKELCAGLPWWKRPVGRIMMNRLEGKYDLEEGYHLAAARTIKPVMGHVPLMLVGGMRRVSHMEEVLQNRYADFISMSRPFIREPFLAKRLKEGKSDRAGCVSCNKCLATVASVQPVKCHYKPSDIDPL